MDESFRFEYGQTVRIVASAPTPLQPGTDVDIVGMTRFSRTREIFNVAYPAGSDIYLIELRDGKSLEVPEHFIDFPK